MVWVDIIAVVIAGLLFIRGMMKGFVASLLWWIGVTASLILMGKLGPGFAVFVQDSLGMNPTAAIIVTDIAILFVIMLIILILTKILTKLLNLLQLSTLNRLLGGVFGILTALALFLVIHLGMLFTTPTQEHLEHWKETTYTFRVTDIIVSNIHERVDLPHPANIQIDDHDLPKADTDIDINLPEQ